MTPHYLNIGKAAAAAGMTPKMVRHYEALGLVPEAGRTDAGYRLYGEREVGLLRFIRQCRTLDFSMAQIRELLQLWADERRPSRSVKALAQRQLGEMEQRQRELDQMRSTLSGLVELCADDEAPHCAILERLQSAAPASGRAHQSAPLRQVSPGTRRTPQGRSAGARTPVPPRTAAHALMAWSHAAATLA